MVDLTLEQFADRLRASIDSVTLTGSAFVPLYQSLGPAAVGMVKTHFVEGRAPDGTPWAPLAHPRPDGSSVPLRDTGGLMASITFKADADGLAVGTNHVAAKLHQAGGTVTPKKAKYLAIPLTKRAKRAGSPRSFGELAVRMRKGANKCVMVSVRGRGKGEAQYALVQSVTVPARPFVGFSAAEMDRLGQLAAAWVAKKLVVALTGAR